MVLLEEAGAEIAGANAVVLGRQYCGHACSAFAGRRTPQSPSFTPGQRTSE